MRSRACPVRVITCIEFSFNYVVCTLCNKVEASQCVRPLRCVYVGCECKHMCFRSTKRCTQSLKHPCFCVRARVCVYVCVCVRERV